MKEWENNGEKREKLMTEREGRWEKKRKITIKLRQMRYKWKEKRRKR